MILLLIFIAGLVIGATLRMLWSHRASTWYLSRSGSSQGNNSGDEPSNAAPVARCNLPFRVNAGDMIRILPALLLAFSLQLSAFAATNSVGLAWNPVPGTNIIYKVWIGTNSGSYQSSLSYSSTNAWLDPAWLAPGTNYVAVSAVQNVNTNLALISTYSSEVRIVKIPPPAPLQLVMDAQTSSNLVAWTVQSNAFTMAVTPDRPDLFVRPLPGSLRIASIPPTTVILPPSP